MNDSVRHGAPRHAGSVWAITCYFNPINYRRRLENYHTFRQRLTVPLLTVELSFDEHFQLGHDDADIVLQLHGRDVMWQKERLLNVALHLVPDSCEHIAWLDCDVVFESSDWPERARLALDRFALLRLFHKRHDLSPGELPGQLCCNSMQPMDNAVVQERATEEAMSQPAAAPLLGRNTPGLAWAARRDVLEQHGLYDACILGSGDRAMLCAALGQFDYVAQTLRMNTRRLEHYLAWARPFFASVGGQVGYIHGRLFHLWHGDRSERAYRERHGLLDRYDFDPYIDITVDRDGCWRWNSEKRDLHESVRRYFQSRREDGTDAYD